MTWPVGCWKRILHCLLYNLEECRGKKSWMTSAIFSLPQCKRIPFNDFIIAQLHMNPKSSPLVPILRINPNAEKCSYFYWRRKCWITARIALASHGTSAIGPAPFSTWAEAYFSIHCTSEEVTPEGFLWAQLQPETYLKTCWRVTALRSWESFV